MSFEVLFVCTGNICRSPLAERLMAARVRPAPGLRIRSAGTRAVVGYPMEASSALVLRELGGDPDGHAGAQLELADVAAAGVILTATTQHRATVIQADPAAMRRTFTLREFARLAAALPAPSSLGAARGSTDAATGPAGGFAERVAAVAAVRGQIDAPPPGGDDIGDPLGASLDVVRACGSRIGEAVDAVVAVLGLAR